MESGLGPRTLDLLTLLALQVIKRQGLCLPLGIDTIFKPLLSLPQHSSLIKNYFSDKMYKTFFIGIAIYSVAVYKSELFPLNLLHFVFRTMTNK